jgi:UDP-N-acetylglucosamine--N-acetylmuramyl-(pentapeptide) pyrophosphoryl-undecaprenol N-acetylglucosamine transferase
VYPALAAVQSLKQQFNQTKEGLELLWVGSAGGMEEALVERAGLKIESIAAKGLRGKNPLAFLTGLWNLGQGYRQSQKIIDQFRPDSLFITGGYVCVPITLAAYRARIPILIYLPDIEPGLAIKFLARFVQRVAVTAEETLKFFKPGQAVVTGYPVRVELAAASLREDSKEAARRLLGLSQNLPVLLVFGGSRGARSINQAVSDHLETFLQVCQIVHISGTLDEAWVQARRAELPPLLQARYFAFAYLHEEMTSALLAADLVVSRAGASVLGEFPVIGLPAILVPYPYAGTHQALNADYLARHQAALVIEDADLKEQLKETIIGLMTQPEKLQAMSEACRKLAKPEASDHLAHEIVEVGSHARD